MPREVEEEGEGSLELIDCAEDSVQPSAVVNKALKAKSSVNSRRCIS